MTMTNDIAKLRIARVIQDAEAALDVALLKQSQLLSAMIIARQDTAAKPFTGHEAMSRLLKSQQSLLASGGDLARVHGKLLDISREYGDISRECPKFELEQGLDAAAA